MIEKLKMQTPNRSRAVKFWGFTETLTPHHVISTVRRNLYSSEFAKDLSYAFEMTYKEQIFKHQTISQKKQNLTALPTEVRTIFSTLQSSFRM